MEEKKQLSFSIGKALQSLYEVEVHDYAEISNLLEVPRDPENGDLALPCFFLAKKLRKAPQMVCSDIASFLIDNTDHPAACFTDEVRPVGPFLNFRFKQAEIAARVLSGVLEGSFLEPSVETKEKVMVEYSQQNTHKAFHVGHIRCAALGDTVVRLLEWNGHPVIAANYFGDEGTHVARCLWAYLNHRDEDPPEEMKGEYLGKLYVKATELLDLGRLTDVPLPGVIAAKVVSKAEHPRRPEWVVLTLDSGSDESVQVVTACQNAEIGDIVPYATPGTRVVGRVVGAVERDGVESLGMVCNGVELGINGNEDIEILDSSVAPGEYIAEIFAKEGCSDVLQQHTRMREEVGSILAGIESQKGPYYELWKETKEWSLQEFYVIYDWLNCRFDHLFSESETGEESRKIAQEFLEKGVFEVSDGAIGADLRDKGLGFCLLIKSDGTTMYACRDLALARRKFEDFKVEKSYYVVDSAQKLHFQQVFECLRLMGYKDADKCVHLDYAQVVRPDGKMSSRKGNVILFWDLKERLSQKIRQDYLDKFKQEWSEEEILHAAHIISLASMRYGMLKQENNSEIIFDIDEWCAQSGNTGPYLLYAYARMSSILRESESEGKADYKLLLHARERELVMHMAMFRQTVKRAAEGHSPHVLCQFLYELSKLFNGFYRDCPVRTAETKELGDARVALVKGIAVMLEKGLSLLGIPVLSRM